MQLDYSLSTAEERAALVEKITASTPKSQLTPKYLEILGDYILDALPKEEKKDILTQNRLITINKRETSFEGLAEKFENGEDGLYNLMTNDKNIIFQPKVTISARDVAEIPGMADLREAIDSVEASAAQATGKRKYLLKKQAIEMRRDQYVLKNAYRSTIGYNNTARTHAAQISLDEERWVDEHGEPQSKGLITLFNPAHVSAILCNYIGLKNQTAGAFQDDFYYLMSDFDNIMARALAPYPMYLALARYKIAECSNAEIQERLFKEFGIKHSVEYLSALWRKKIPTIIAERAKDEYLVYYYQAIKPEDAVWKKCSRCGSLKLAHPRFFSKNNTSKDGFYSICKECRNKKKLVKPH